MTGYYIFIRRIFINSYYVCSLIFIITDRSKAVLLLWFILIVYIRPLSMTLSFFRAAWWSSAGTGLSSWLSVVAVLILCCLN